MVTPRGSVLAAGAMCLRHVPPKRLGKGRVGDRGACKRAGLQTACAEARRWRRAGVFAHPVWLCQLEGCKGTPREASRYSQRGGAGRQPGMVLCGSHLRSARLCPPGARRGGVRGDETSV